jgi:hypothetical protein
MTNVMRLTMAECNGMEIILRTAFFKLLCKPTRLIILIYGNYMSLCFTLTHIVNLINKI